MRLKWVLFICVASLLSGCIGSRMGLSEGIRSFQVQDYRQAFIRLMPEAKAGNRDAEYAIGFMYWIIFESGNKICFLSPSQTIQHKNGQNDTPL